MASPLDRAKESLRLVRNQHAIRPFTHSAILHFSADGDDVSFFRKIRSLLNTEKHDLSFVFFREKSETGKRPHYHLLFRSTLSKPAIRRLFVRALTDERTGTSKTFILRHFKPVTESDFTELVTYWTKATPALQKKNVPLPGRNRGDVGDVWSDKTTELKKVTSEQIHERVNFLLTSDPIFSTYVTCEYDPWYRRVEDPTHAIDLGRASTDPHWWSWWVRQFTKDARRYDYVQKTIDRHDEFGRRATYETTRLWAKEIARELEARSADIIY